MPTITYNIPAGQQADIIDALRAHYGVPAATAAELNGLLAKDVKDKVRAIYREHMRKKLYDVSLD